MRRTRVKICGVMRAEDARVASLAGADAVGMIFHPPSKRSISVERAREIVGALGAFVTPVGVFVDAPTERVVETARGAGLRTVQLHGRERGEQVLELGARGLAVLKAVRVDGAMETELEYWRGQGEAIKYIVGFVLETGETKEAGGTGVENDFERIRQLQQSGAFDGLPPIVVAGGLRAETVRGVVEMLRPWAVDVSSGVERVVGIKDEGTLREFIEAARAGDGVE
jgi:phosphoribosylanthranilate isomerase